MWGKLQASLHVLRLYLGTTPPHHPFPQEAEDYNHTLALSFTDHTHAQTNVHHGHASSHQPGSVQMEVAPLVGRVCPLQAQSMQLRLSQPPDDLCGKLLERARGLGERQCDPAY